MKINKCWNCGENSNPISPMNLGDGEFCSMDCEIEHQLKQEEKLK